ncbi:MAG: hypothetical protein AAGJ32_06635 [Pseudomonadota bacterium]
MNWSPRPSVALRLKHFGAAPEDRPLPLEAPISSLDGNFSVELINNLTIEAQQVAAGLVLDLNAMDPAVLANGIIEIDTANWATGGRARFIPCGTAILSVSIGFCLALEDAILTHLSQGAVFFADGGVRPAKIQSCQSQRPSDAHHFHDYTSLRERAFTAEDVTGGLPFDPSRLRQHDLLFQLTLRWALLHEVAHLALCHLDLLNRLWGPHPSGLSIIDVGEENASGHALDRWAHEFCGDGTPPIAPFDKDDVRQVMELQADVWATDLSVALDRTPFASGQGMFNSYERDVQAMDVPGSIAFATLTGPQRRRLLIFCAFIAMGLFERARHGRYGRFAAVSRTHPSPQARLTHLVRTFAAGGDRPSRPPGRVRNAPCAETLACLANAMADFKDFCRTIDINVGLLDLADHLCPTGKATPCKSINRELRRLAAYDAPVKRMCEHLQIQKNSCSFRFGRGSLPGS